MTWKWFTKALIFTALLFRQPILGNPPADYRTENFDVDLGVKFGLTDSETDITALAGVAFRF